MVVAFLDANPNRLHEHFADLALEALRKGVALQMSQYPMLSTFLAFLAGAVVVVLCGYCIVTYFMAYMRKRLKRDDGEDKPTMDFALGGTERFIALALFVYSPANLPWFIGAWVAAKYAANWKRWPAPPNTTNTAEAQTTENDSTEKPKRTPKQELEYVAEGSLLFLIGNALSFGIAIAVGLLVTHCFPLLNAFWWE